MGSPVTLPPGAVLDKAALPPGAVLDAAEKPSLLSDVGDTLKQYWDKINPVKAVQGAAQVAAHPIEAVKGYGETTSKLADSAKESFKKGEYGQAVRHSLSYFLNAIPGLGSALDEAGNKAEQGDVKGAIADTAALATQIAAPKILGAASEAGPAAVETAANAVRAAGEAVKTGGKDVAVGGAKTAAGIALAKAGPLGEVGDVIAGVPIIKSGVQQVSRGFQKGYAALKQSLADSAAAKPSAPSAAPEPRMAGAVPMEPSATVAPPSPISSNPTPIPRTGEIKLPESANELFDNLTSKKTPASETHPEGAYPIKPEERTEPASIAPKESYVKAAQTVKGRALARYLRLGQITQEEAQSMTPAQWQMAAEGTGVNVPSEASIKVALSELDNLYKAKGSILIDKAIEENNPAKANFFAKKAIEEAPMPKYLAKNPKALKIAQQLQQLHEASQE